MTLEPPSFASKLANHQFRGLRLANEKGGTDCLATSVTGYHTLDFFWWGYVTDIVYQAKIWDITDLKIKITDAISTTDEHRGNRVPS